MPKVNRKAVPAVESRGSAIFVTVPLDKPAPPGWPQVFTEIVQTEPRRSSYLTMSGAFTEAEAVVETELSSLDAADDLGGILDEVVALVDKVENQFNDQQNRIENMKQAAAVWQQRQVNP